jgi:hypothetical protein
VLAPDQSLNTEHIPDPLRSREPEQGDEVTGVSGHVNSISGESSTEDTHSATHGRRKRQETMQEMVDRVSRFIEV